METPQHIPNENAPLPAPVVPQFRRVLVSTDLSPAGDDAVRYAYALLPSGGEVRIVHVEEQFEFADPAHAHTATLMPLLAEKRASEVLDCRLHLQGLVPPEASARGVRTQIGILPQDNPATAICREAESFQADVICIASQGRSALARAVFGSVTRSVLGMTGRPVLLVRSSAA